MELILGGYAQGKLAYAQSRYPDADVLDAQDWDCFDRVCQKNREKNQTVILNQFHLVVRACIRRDASVDEEALGHLMDQIMSYEGALVVICDEIGNGVVPVDPMERTYREETGRALIALAARAERVERVVSGIAQQIKP